MNTPSLPASLWVTLGLTGAMTSAVSCGPCLSIAPNDSATDTGDTGEPEGDRRQAPPAATEGDRSAAAQRVLDRDILPPDVAALLRRRSQPSSSH